MPGQNLLGACTAMQDAQLAFTSLTITFSATGTASQVRSAPTAGTITTTTTAAASLTLTREPYDPSVSFASPGAFQLAQSECCCFCRWGIVPPEANQVIGVPWAIFAPIAGTTVHTDTLTPSNDFTVTYGSGDGRGVTWRPNGVNDGTGNYGGDMILISDNSQPCLQRSGVPLPVAGSPVFGAIAGFFGSNFLASFPEVWDDPFSPGNHVDVTIKTDGVIQAFATLNGNYTGIFKIAGTGIVIGEIDACVTPQNHSVEIDSSSSFSLISQPGIGPGAATSSLTVTATIALT